MLHQNSRTKGLVTWLPCCFWMKDKRYVSNLWQFGLWSFQTGVKKLERFVPRNQHTQRKLLNFENWVNREVSESVKKYQNLTFKVNFLSQKLSESFSFFSLKNINSGAYFLLLTVFDNINFKSLYFLKDVQFLTLPVNPILKIQ